MRNSLYGSVTSWNGSRVTGLLAVKSGFILFIKNYQFPLQINTLERERRRERRGKVNDRCWRGVRRGHVADWPCLVRVSLLCLLLCMFVSFLAPPC